MRITRLFGLEYSIGDGNSIFEADYSSPDLVVGSLDDIPADAVDGDGRKIVCSWPGVGTFHVENGREITTDLVDDADPTAVRNFLTGIGLGILLYQDGHLVVHGSVAEVDGETVAFVGNKRAGKSTSATALLARGHEFLSDDIVAVRFDDDGAPLVVPSFPMFKFDPETFDDTPLPAAPAPDPETGTGKLYYRLNGEFDWSERPLTTICLLDPNGDGPRRERLTGHDALMAVLEHSWSVRLQTADYVDHERSTIEDPDLDRYARLVEHCRVLRVSLDHDHDTLDALGRDLESVLGVEPRPDE